MITSKQLLIEESTKTIKESLGSNFLGIENGDLLFFIHAKKINRRAFETLSELSKNNQISVVGISTIPQKFSNNYYRNIISISISKTLPL